MREGVIMGRLFATNSLPGLVCMAVWWPEHPDVSEGGPLVALSGIHGPGAQGRENHVPGTAGLGATALLSAQRAVR